MFIYSTTEEWQDKCIAAQSAINWPNLVLPLGKDNALKLYGNPVYSSVSRFGSSYCLLYYIQYGLRAKEEKIFNLTLPDIGTFLHL